MSQAVAVENRSAGFGVLRVGLHRCSCSPTLESSSSLFGIHILACDVWDPIVLS